MRVSPDRLLLDEMFSPRIAALLGEAGIDCTSVATEPILRTQDDAAVADAALVQRRILVTNNVVDFEGLSIDAPCARSNSAIGAFDSRFEKQEGLHRCLAATRGRHPRAAMLSRVTRRASFPMTGSPTFSAGSFTAPLSGTNATRVSSELKNVPASRFRCCLGR